MERAVIKSLDDFGNFAEEFIKEGRLGEIALPVPVLNISEWHTNPNYYALALGMTAEEFDKVAYFSNMVVVSSDIDGFSAGDILDAARFAEYESLPAESKEKISVVGGAEAIRFLIERLDTKEMISEARSKEIKCMQKLEALYDKYDELGGDETSRAIHAKMMENLRDSDEEGVDKEAVIDEEDEEFMDIEKDIGETQITLSKTRCLLTALRYVSRHESSRLVIEKIDLFPIDLRPALKEAMSDAPYIIYDIETQYRKVWSYAERVAKLMGMNAPLIILRNEKRMLQERVDSLIDNGARGSALLGRGEGFSAASLMDVVKRRTRLV